MTTIDPVSQTCFAFERWCKAAKVRPFMLFYPHEVLQEFAREQNRKLGQTFETPEDDVSSGESIQWKLGPSRGGFFVRGHREILEPFMILENGGVVSFQDL